MARLVTTQLSRDDGSAPLRFFITRNRDVKWRLPAHVRKCASVQPCYSDSQPKVQELIETTGSRFHSLYLRKEVYWYHLKNLIRQSRRSANGDARTVGCTISVAYSRSCNEPVIETRFETRFRCPETLGNP
jgi:hypothetical protein